VSRPLLARWPAGLRTLHRALAWSLAILPLPVARVLAWGAGVAAWSLDAIGRRRVERNRAGWSGPHRAAGCYAGFGLMLADAAGLLRADRRRRLVAEVRIHDPHGVFAVQPHPGPAIIATLHANWELLGATLLGRGLSADLTSLVLSTGNPPLDAWTAAGRLRSGHQSLPLGPVGIGRALTRLRAGGVLGLAIDRDYGGDGLWLRFGQQYRRIPRGAAALARRCGCPILPILLLRRRAGDHLLLVSAPCPPPRHREEEAVVMQTVVDRLVRRLAMDPRQWVAFHREASAPGDAAPGMTPRRPRGHPPAVR
jgi:lauroyl/myristoyl acyltransferase